MLRQAIRGGTRWCHGARCPSLPRCTFGAVAARRLHFGGPNDKVNYYEQDNRASKVRRRVDPEAEDNEQREEVEIELSKLQEELEELEKGPFEPDSPFIQSLPENDRKVALEALRKYKEDQGPSAPQPSLKDVFDDELDDMLQEEFQSLAKEQEDWQDSARTRRKLASQKARNGTLADLQDHPYSAKFRGFVQQFSENPKEERTRQELWKSYRRCKQSVPDFLEDLTPETMSLIWESQTTAQLTKSTRSVHLQNLVKDMQSVGQSLSIPQILSYIEALHSGGATNQALEQWEHYQSDLSRKKEDLEEYWMLGVRLFAAEDNPQRAQDIALAFLANDQSRQPRVLIPVITAWGRLPGKEAEVKAWSLYLQLKTFLGIDMTMEDYDQISIGLLTAGRLDTAVAIFKDMMVTGQDPANDSTALYKSALGLAGNLQASSINEQAVNKVSLSVLTMLPRRFQNRFFYASWMKKLIGMGDVDSAALVIELMYERGVKPDTKHLNGVMAGWLREGNAAARDKAERLGWSMIQHRVDAAWKRFQPAEQSPQIQIKHPQTIESGRIPKFLQREVPPASIETFSILLLHYTRRGDDDMVKYLIKCLGDAHLQPNSYFMNHLLYSDLRKQDIRSLWTKFEKMSASIRPDLETFACLWDCAKLQYDRGRTAFDAGFPSARQLYARMAPWYSQLSQHARANTRSQFSKELYDQIVRCFCLSKDLGGTLVALQSMRDLFGYAPDDVTARLIVLQVARLAGVPADTPKRRLRRLSSTPRSKENIGQVTRLLEMLSDRKSMALKAQGLSVEQLDPHEKQQYQLEVMANLLRIVLARTDNLDPVQVEAKLAQAAAEMHVQGIDLGSPLGVNDSQLL
ncbi:hypothetical protein N7462_008733 [Penicillium macrosclerotiorum]|uniref:uncharacterized protein n=1 Tax=Penicillium macrosclerotiorum TaxID=303699 RepID=UPI002549BC53|nr:uncharacterized protein N7462_008733 [Penicillium macrosclerotiorum]KAJ5675836.1 hypothetical protein N7462_008733 [Penicillium macrosclerotiorum]